MNIIFPRYSFNYIGNVMRVSNKDQYKVNKKSWLLYLNPWGFSSEAFFRWVRKLWIQRIDESTGAKGDKSFKVNAA